jgi:hypothetical protein
LEPGEGRERPIRPIVVVLDGRPGRQTIDDVLLLLLLLILAEYCPG